MLKWLRERDKEELRDMLRMWPTLVVALITFGIVHAIAPQQSPILVYTVAKISIAGYMGYWLDRWVFPESRPGPSDDAPPIDWVRICAELRRGAIIIGAMISSALMM